MAVFLSFYPHRANGQPTACHRLHFKKIVQPHTDPSLGNCSYLDTCRNMRTCRYIHYAVDPQPDVVGPMGHHNQMELARMAQLRANVPK